MACEVGSVVVVVEEEREGVEVGELREGRREVGVLLLLDRNAADADGLILVLSHLEDYTHSTAGRSSSPDLYIEGKGG